MQVSDFVARMQTDNLKLMKDYMQLSASGQKQYMESLLVDFSKYLDEQRNQDLLFIRRCDLWPISEKCILTANRHDAKSSARVS